MPIKNWFYLKKDAAGIRKDDIEDPTDTYVNIVDVDSPNSGNVMSVSDFSNFVNTLNFKKGSIGEKVSFTKESGSDPAIYKDVIIPGLLEITRSNNGGGIFNIAQEDNFNGSVSPVNTYWNTQYVDPANTSWVSLWDVQNRAYDTWRNAAFGPNANPAPPQYVGIPAVMKYDDGDTVRYWLIMFTEWGVGQYSEYGFAYDRWEILPAVTIEQPSTDNSNTPNVIDILSEGVHITRSYEGGQIYNIVNEPYAESGVSPRNTKWNSSFIDSREGYSGFQDLSNLESRVYTDFAYALDGQVGNNVLDTDLIMHDLTTDLYYKVVFDSWAQGNSSGGPGGVTAYTILNSGSGYPDGYYGLNGVDGNGTGISFNVTVTEGTITSIDNINNRGENYLVGDIITFPYVQTDLFTIQVDEVVSMGGFAYTRTVIPQSCGIKFADGTIMNTAVTASAGAAGTEMNYVQGILSPEVESDFIKISDTIITAPVSGSLSSFYNQVASGSWILGTYNDVPITGGSGYGATANITIYSPGGYSFEVSDAGQNYEVNDNLSISVGGIVVSLVVGSVVNTPAVTNSVYKLGGIANFQDGGSNAYSYLIGVIVGDENLKLISDSTTISAPVNTFEKVSGKFAVNAYVRDDSGNPTPLTFATIVLDNSIANQDAYFVSIVANASPDWTGTAYIDIEFMSEQTLSYYN